MRLANCNAAYTEGYVADTFRKQRYYRLHAKKSSFKPSVGETQKGKYKSA